VLAMLLIPPWSGPGSPREFSSRVGGAGPLWLSNDDGTAEINDRTYAAFSVVDEHRRLSEAILASVAMIGDLQTRTGFETVNFPNLELAMDRMLAKSRRTMTDGLLFAVSIDDKSPIDEGLIDAIAKSGDEAGEIFERLDAEIRDGEDHR
jgi:hypothetical protein